MNISLNYHSQKYTLGWIDLCVCSLTLFTALPLARRHFEQANKPYEAKWTHRILAVIECMPILGAIVALIEYCICTKCIFDRRLVTTTFQAAQSVVEFQQLPQAEQQRLEKSVFKMLQATTSQVHEPRQFRGTGFFSNDYSEYCNMTQNCTPEEFVQKLQTDINKRGSIKFWWAETYYGDSALHWAVRSGRTELIKHVLNYIQEQGQPHLLNWGNEILSDTPLMTAMRTNFVSPQANREEIVDLLLAAQADPNQEDANWSTPLFLAIETGQIAFIRRLLLHPDATLHCRRSGKPIPNVSEQGRATLLIVYRQIENALREGLQLVVAHTDVHSIIAGYYWRG